MLFIFLLSSAIFYDRLRGGSIGEAIFGYARSLYRKIYSFLLIRRNFLLIVFLISLLLRGFFAFKSSSTPLGYGGTDSQTYVGIAMRKADRNIDKLRPVDEGARRVYNTLAKKEVIPWPAPGYYYYLSLVFKIFGPNFLVVELIQAFWGALVCIGVYYIGSKIFGEAVGRIAALMTALSGMLTNHAIYVASESIYIPLLSLALALLIRPVEKRKFLSYGIAGLALGLAIITRPVIFYFIPVIILWMLISSGRKKVLPGIKYSLVVLLMIFLAMLPLTIRNYIYLNRFTLFTSFYESEDFFWRLYDPEEVGKYYKPGEGDPQNIKELRASDIRVIKAFISYIFHNAYSFGRAYWKRFVNFWMGYDVVNFDHIFLYTGSKYSYAMRLYFYVFAIYGLILSLKEWRHNWQEKLLFYLLIAYYVIFHIIIYVSTRHRTPIQPYIIIFAAYGIYHLLKNWDFVRSKKLETSV